MDGPDQATAVFLTAAIDFLGAYRSVDFRSDGSETREASGLQAKTLHEPAMLLVRTLLRRRRPPLPVAATGFFTSSGSDALAPPPPRPPVLEWPHYEPEQEGSLARRLERAASVGAAMRGWMADGRAVHRGHVFHAVNRLRRHRLHRTALQVAPLPFFLLPVYRIPGLVLDSLILP